MIIFDVRICQIYICFYQNDAQSLILVMGRQTSVRFPNSHSFYK
jgi:hypothetical protein